MEDTTKTTTYCGFIAILGRTSVGKSTFLNTALGHNTAITSSVPQTTRNIIRGIKTVPPYQCIFLDTPGVHCSERRFNAHLMKQVKSAITHADIVLYMLDITRAIGVEETQIIELLQAQTIPIVVACNKIDYIGRSTKYAKNISASATLTFVKTMMPQSTVTEISAKTGAGIDVLIAAICPLLPSGPYLYPTEYYTDQTTEFRICEQVRAATIEFLKEEIPHAVYTELLETSIKHKDADGNITHVFARVQIVVERPRQLAIIVGKGGSMIKKIREHAARRLRPLFDYRIQLELKVAVKKKWRTDINIISKFT